MESRGSPLISSQTRWTSSGLIEVPSELEIVVTELEGDQPGHSPEWVQLVGSKVALPELESVEGEFGDGE